MDLVIQGHETGCTSACLAMILGASYDEVHGEFDHLYKQRRMTSAGYLRKKGKIVRTFSGLEQWMCKGHIYILAVPSLNMEARLHAIVYDVKSKEHEILDPRKDGSHRYYTLRRTGDPLAVPLGDFVIDAEII